MPEDTAITFMDVLIGWSPMLIVVIMFVFYMLAVSRASKSSRGVSHPKMLELHLEEQKRNQELTEKLFASFEKRIANLEEEIQRLKS